MATKIISIFVVVCAVHAAKAGMFRLGLNAVIAPAQAEVGLVAANFLNLIIGSGDKADQLLSKLHYKVSNPEGILGLVTETNMAITRVGNGTNVSDCTAAEKPKLDAMVQTAGVAAKACYDQADKALQPYRNTVSQQMQKSQQISAQIVSDMTTCITNNPFMVVSCKIQALQQLANAKDSFVATSDFKSKATEVVNNFTTCSINAQDEAIGTSVDAINEARQCISNKTSASNATTTS